MSRLDEIKKFYKGKKVLVTGHTGFKGSWLAFWLNSMGADVLGIDHKFGDKDGIYEQTDIMHDITSASYDILNYGNLLYLFNSFQPELVFHLAAQPIVRESYDNPKLTFETNTQGTINVLECIRNTKSVKSAVMITTDKVYDNKEWIWGYRENDKLGGSDPYSASKACAELAIKSYYDSFFKLSGVNIASVRAGNVIGGGDWAKDRIMVDIIKSIKKGNVLEVRSPNSTRPFQHVLEPLWGYLLVGKDLFDSKIKFENYNFGPDQSHVISVKELVTKIQAMSDLKWIDKSNPNNSKKESVLLSLDSTKAKNDLGWEGKLSIDETLRITLLWYQQLNEQVSMDRFTKFQIEEYEDLL